MTRPYKATAPVIGVQWGNGFVRGVIRRTAAFTVLCPHCERHHTHGAMLGHRSAHCVAGKGAGGYEIVLSDMYTTDDVWEQAQAAIEYMEELSRR